MRSRPTVTVTWPANSTASITASATAAASSLTWACSRASRGTGKTGFSSQGGWGDAGAAPDGLSCSLTAASLEASRQLPSRSTANPPGASRSDRLLGDGHAVDLLLQLHQPV